MTPEPSGELPLVEAFTDGACKGNPGPGGWGVLLRAGEKERELSGSEYPTTNNRMELTAAIEALNALKKPCRVKISTDSRYVMDGPDQVDPRLAQERLAHCGQEAGQERRTLAGAGRG